MHSYLKPAALAVAALLITAACSTTHHDEMAGTYAVDDSTLTARAKEALAKDKHVDANDFSVQSYEGHITLTGMARTHDEARQAEEDVRNVPGVRSVTNDVRIAEAETTTPPPYH